MTDYDRVIFEHYYELDRQFCINWLRMKLHHVMSLSISFAHYRQMQGSSYIPTPNELVRKPVVLNTQNLDDNYCILYAILAHIHPLTRDDHPNRPQKYIQFLSELNSE